MTTSILFDLDGVLTDTKPLQFLSLRDALRDCCSVDVQKTEALTRDITTREKLSNLSKAGIIREDQIEEIYNRKKEIANEYFANMTPKPEKIDLFKFLEKEKIGHAIVTNANRASSLLLLESIGISPYLKTLISNEDVNNPKPHPEPYIRGLLSVGGKFDDFVVLEDSEVGMASAHAAGLPVYKVLDVDDVSVEFIKNILKERK